MSSEIWYCTSPAILSTYNFSNWVSNENQNLPEQKKEIVCHFLDMIACEILHKLKFVEELKLQVNWCQKKYLIFLF